MSRFQFRSWLRGRVNRNLRPQTRRRKEVVRSAAGFEQLEQRALLSAVVVDLDSGGITATDLAQSLVGSGVSISNVVFTGDLRAAGTFTDGFTDGLDIDAGVLLSSGRVLDAPGPNDTESVSTSLATAGDADLNTISAATTEDAAILEFDFIPTEDTLSFAYLFASDEYPEFAPPNDSSYNDVFAFFLDGVNIATLPNSGNAVTINNVNAVTNSTFYNDNSQTPSPFGTQYDGFTTAFSAVASVTPGIETHIKLAVADAGDGEFDSTVFLRAGSFVAKPVVSIQATDPNASEDPLDSGLYTISRTGDTTDPLTVFFTQGGTATSIDDFTALPASIVIPAGSSSVPLSLDPVNDGDVETDETVILTLSADVAYAVDAGQQEATVTIVSDDIDPPDVAFDVEASSIVEGAGFVSVTVVRTGDVSAITQVDVTLNGGGSATSGVDFDDGGFPNLLTFSAGQETATFTIDITDDNIDEPHETFVLGLAVVSNGEIGSPATSTITILDDDPTPDVIIMPLSGAVNEGDPADFEVSLTNPSSEDVVLTIGTADGTAMASSDYDGTAQQLTIPAGQTTASSLFSVNTFLDGLFEGFNPESFSVAVQSIDAGSVDDTSATATGEIIDGDFIPVVSIQSNPGSNVTEGDTATFDVVLNDLNGASFENITVTVHLFDGTATAPGDYDDSPITVTIPAGELMAGFEVPTVNDGIHEEAAEFYDLVIDSVDVGEAFIGAGVQGLIFDDDSVPTISVNDVTVPEDAGTATFNVSLSSPSDLPVSFNFVTADDTAIDGLDYGGIGGAFASWTFSPGQTELQIDVPIFEDDLDEPDERFFLELSSPVNATFAEPTGEAIIVDNDPTPAVIITSVSGPVTEGNVAEFEVSLTNPSSEDVVLTIGTTDGTATAPDDYDGSLQQLSIPAGQLSAIQQFSVETFVDGLFEGVTPEEFSVGVLSVDAGNVGDTSATAPGVIIDIDDVPQVWIQAIPESNVVEGEVAMFEVRLTAASTEDITVTVAGGTHPQAFLEASPDDYDDAPQQVTIQAGSMSSPVFVSTVDDLIDEADVEEFGMNLVSIDSGSAVRLDLGPSLVDAIGSITDNDASPTISIAGDSAVEGDPLAFEVVLSAASGLTISVDVDSFDGDATDGLDYFGFAGTLTFDPGETEQTITVGTIVDSIDEPDEFLILELSDPSNAGLGPTTNAVGTIIDANETPEVLIGDVMGDEGTIASFVIELSGASSQETILTIGTTDGTAVSPDDYTGPNATVTIPAGSTAATTTFDVDLLSDDQSEGDETYTVGVVSIDAGAVNTGDTGIGTIFNVANAVIIDDGDQEFSNVGNWTQIAGNNKGHLNDFDLSTPGNGSNTSTWTFDLTEQGGAGVYDVSVSFREWTNRATNAPYTVFDGTAALATVSVNQIEAADDIFDSGTWFESLGTFSIFGKILTVELGNNADSFVVADAVRVERIGDIVDGPDVLVEESGVAINDNTGLLNFGDVSLSANETRILTVSNNGNQDLTLIEPISLPAGFSLMASFGALTLAPGGATTFEIAADTSALGPIGGEISFSSNDPDEEPYNFQVSANVVAVTIIDDGEPGYSNSGSWTRVVGGGKGFLDDFRFASPGDGGSASTWTFNVGPGQYLVSASWRAHTNRATDAVFSIDSDVGALTSVQVNQQVAPGSRVDGGTAFEDLATVNVFGSTITVTLDNLANGLTIADAVRLERIGDVILHPEIVVDADGNDIVDGTGVFDFGTVFSGDAAEQTFTVSNSGTTPLLLDGTINVPAGFSLVSGFGSSVLLPAESTTFVVAMDTSAVGTVAGEISFTNNDADESPFNFGVQGEVEAFTAIVDDSTAAPGFSTVGSWSTVNRNGINGGFQYSVKGTGSSVARWTFNLPSLGDYRVSVAYQHYTNRVTDAPFTLFDGATPLTTVLINQQNAADDVFDGGRWFEDLATINVTGAQLSVELSNFSTDLDPAHILLIADAIRIERIG